ELRVEPRALAQRIERRTRRMFEAGLIEETAALVEHGRKESLCALRAVGDDECLELLEGRLTRVEAEARTNLRTRQLAKRQRTWFRHQLKAEILDGAASLPKQLCVAREAFGPSTRRD